MKHNSYFYFNPVNNKEKNKTERQFCFSDNIAFCGMAYSLCFGRSVKIENWKLHFQPKHSKQLTELTKREGEGSIRMVIFLPLAPSPQIPFPPCEFFFVLFCFFFCPCPPPSPPTLHFSEKEEAGNNSYMKVHTANRWTIRHGLMLFWFTNYWV